MNILMTGGTGFIGSALTATLLDQGHRVTILSRSREKVTRMFADTVTPLTDLKRLPPADSFDVVVNLAGAPIFGQRWTDNRKKVLRDSRIGLTQELIEVIAAMERKPRLLISGSAIGYYGDQGDRILTEQNGGGDDFAHRLCADWEQTALQAESHAVRVCLVRTGLVLGAGGGLLKQMLLPFKLGLGGRIGDGEQWMSWIHLRDWISIAITMMEDSNMQGPYNAAAPHPVTNRQFTETLANVLKRPACLPMPAFALKTLLGEMSELVLGSQRVLPDRLLKQGFEFQFSDLNSALRDILD